MDTKTLIKNLTHIFCEKNKSEKRYAEVWLSDVDFGGLYQSSKHVLNVKAQHQLGNCNQEIKEILKMLENYAKEELQYIWRVDVYNADKEIHCQSDEILIYSEEKSCQ